MKYTFTAQERREDDSDRGDGVEAKADGDGGHWDCRFSKKMHK
jgi:hypothetical protein